MASSNHPHIPPTTPQQVIVVSTVPTFKYLSVDDIINQGPSPSDDRYQHPDDYVYTIITPSHLAQILSAPNGPDDNGPLAAIRHIRLCILRPLHKVKLTRDEIKGTIEGSTAPHLGPLVDAWRSAVRNMPSKHQIRTVDFDMTCPETQIELRPFARLLQYIGTVMVMRSADEMQFRASGCSERHRNILEDTLPRKCLR